MSKTVRAEADDIADAGVPLSSVERECFIHGFLEGAKAMQRRAVNEAENRVDQGYRRGDGWVSRRRTAPEIAAAIQAIETE